MKKLWKRIAVAVLALSIVCVGNISKVGAASVKDANKAYEQFVKKLSTKKKYKEGVYTALVKSGKGSKVLLVTDGTFEGDPKDAKEQYAVGASVYQYVKGKVVYVGELASTGTASPLCKGGKYVLDGWHHKSEKMVVNNGKATIWVVDGIYLEKQNATLMKCAVKKGVKRTVYKKTISSKKAEKMDFYCDNAEYKTTPIVFHKGF